MTNLERLRKLLEFQEVYLKKKHIHSLYAEEEKKAKELMVENEGLKEQLEELRINIEEMNKKISEEESKKKELLDKISSLEEAKEKIKVARQMRSWEKDMEKQKQELSIVQAQIDYDTSKLNEMKEEFSSLEATILENEKKIKENLDFVETVKEDNKAELSETEAKEKEIKEDFDLQFIEYFEALLKKTDGNALVEVEREACSGCYTILPTALQGEIGENVPPDEIQIIQCPNCFRFLYHSSWINLE
ncbi:MAG: zinc ribbon domain-containing protein [Brevinematia bacterium]